MQVTLDEFKNDNDVVIQVEDIKLVYDSEIERYVKGIIIDYSNSRSNQGFSVRGVYLASC